MTLNLDDYDRIPCSAKEAWEYMNSGKYCFAGNSIARTEGWQLQRLSVCDSSWVLFILSSTEAMNHDWFKLVPKPGEDHALDAMQYAKPLLTKDRIIADAIPGARLRVDVVPEGRNFSQKSEENKGLSEIATEALSKAILRDKAADSYVKEMQKKLEFTPDRFFEIDMLVGELGFWIETKNKPGVTDTVRAICHAIVELVEKEK